MIRVRFVEVPHVIIRSNIVNASASVMGNVLMWEKLTRQIGAKLERQKLSFADTELQYAGAQAGLSEARRQMELPIGKNVKV